jgi:hypothetical protein
MTTNRVGKKKLVTLTTQIANPNVNVIPMSRNAAH